MNYAGMNVLVVGMARTGLAAAEFLVRRGARVTINDVKPESMLAEAAARARAIGASTSLGSHPEPLFLSADLIVISPGVPMTIPPVQAAVNRGVPVVGDIEIAYREIKGRVCAITGSNGKTTTTALTGRILAGAGYPTCVAGNIGTPLVGMLAEDSPETWFVLEMSSFQLETIAEFRPRVASILNVTPDHLDRYESFGSYARAKRRIYERQRRDDFLVLNADDEMLAHEQPPSVVYYFSRKKEVERGCFLGGSEIVLADEGRSEVLMPVDRIPLKGAHNIENVMAAAAMAHLAGVGRESIRKSVEEFTAVPHRLQFVARVGAVDYYNDSKATNVDATIKALESFAGNIIVILGGKDKGGSYAPLVDLCRSRVKAAITIGQAAEKIRAALEGACRLEKAGSMDEAVEVATGIARPGDTVLLAPACASFDMFRDFEHRGEVFMDAVKRLETGNP